MIDANIQQRPTAIVCTSCSGDPRASTTCAVCGGAGIGIPSQDGFLAWSNSVDDFSILFRKVQRTVTSAIHVGIFAISVICIALFVWQVTLLTDISAIGTLDFYFRGHWFVTMLWAGLLLGCFLIFRIAEYGHESKILPQWGLTKRQISEAHSVSPNHLFDVAPYFSQQALDIIESAYHIAKSLHRIEITPNTLFAACLASQSGGLFMVRLGMKFENIKGPLAALLQKDSGGNPPITLSKEAKRVLALSYFIAREKKRKHVEIMDIFLESFSASESLQQVIDHAGFSPDHVRYVGEWISIQEELRDNQERFTALSRLKPRSTMNRSMTARQTVLLDRFSEDLTLLALAGYVPPVIGREKEIEELLRAVESGSRSVALVGEIGVGKMSIIDGLARRMVEEDVPAALFDKRLVMVNVPQVIAGGDPSLASERFLTILHDAQESGNIILVLQGIEALSNNGGGPMDMAEILASEISRGAIFAIVTTTPAAWTTYIERRTLGSKLVKVTISEPSVEDTIRVLMAKCGEIEYKQKVFFSYAAIEKAAVLADRLIHDKASPAKAFELAREAAVLARKKRGEHVFVNAEDVASVVHEKTGVPVETVSQTEKQKLLSLEDHLHAQIIGQDEAVKVVAQALRRARVELKHGHRPISNFLFLGPTGVGKTELAKVLAAEYFGSEQSMIRLDMSEYQDKSSINRLIGVPGDMQGGLLTEAVRKQPFSIVLLDELEKAHADILTLFLQVMDDGRLTDGVGRTVDFTNTIIIATSNAGAQYIQSEIIAHTPMEQITRGLIERELRAVFRPEFLNRFDSIIVFKPLTLEDVIRIAKLMLAQVSKSIEQKGMSLIVDEDAVEELAKIGFDPQFGARPLRRALQEHVDNLLADLLLQGKVGRKDRIHLHVGGKMTIEKAPEV